MFNKIQNIIFDFDGTIGDTKPIHEKAFLKVFESFYINFNYFDFEGFETKKVIELVSVKNNLNLNESQIIELTKEKQVLAHELIKNEITFIKNADLFLNLVKERKFQIFIGSSGSKKNIIESLNTLKILSLFEDIITKEDINYHKPNPEIYNFIVKKHNLNKSETLIMEDSIAGINASVSANIVCNCVEEKLFDNIDNKANYNYNYLKLLTLFKIT